MGVRPVVYVNPLNTSAQRVAYIYLNGSREYLTYAQKALNSLEGVWRSVIIIIR